MTALFDSEGWYRPATHHPSPNCNDRPDGELPSLIVLHNISLPPNQYGGPGILQLFSNQLNPDEHPYYATIHTLRVSAHFLIRRDGQLLQFVPVLKRAWHAGASLWRGREQCNDFSVGIELEGCDTEAFTSQQYQQLNNLLAALQQQWPSLQAVTGHSDIAPGRKTDPGPCFDWQQLNMPHQAAQ
ncbi:1,6-anhydro-N-acetylmuramyl-L-alanine amidase AmpD [Leeia aquatica]|nr:1,6-anhydro-N-acetylmuramyl-L-alanine amidase AmpD [Leeia aquatica]